MRLLCLSAILVVTSQVVIGCESKTDGPELGVQGFIDSCSPFSKMDEDRQLEATSKIVGLERAHLKIAKYMRISAPHEKPTDAPYTTNEADKTVTIKLKSGDVTYHIAELSGSSCALLAGSPAKANLNDSWFGEKDDD